MQKLFIPFFPFSSIVLSASLLLSFQQTSAVAEEIDIIDHSKAKEVMHGRKDDIPMLSHGSEDELDRQHEELSIKLTNAASWLDSFFGDERSIAEENRTTARVKLHAGYDKYNDFEFKPRLSLRLDTPFTKNRLNLLISASDDEDFDVDRTSSSSSRKDSDSELTAAFHYFLHQTEAMNISTSAGISFDYVYAGLRYRGAYDYGSWQGRFVSRLRYYTDDGWESRNQYDLERQVSGNLLFRTTLEADWMEEENGIPHGVIFTLFQVLRDDRAILYDMGNYFDTRPSYQMTDMVFRLRYRQRFYRDWLVAEVAPQVSFPKEYDREFNPGIIFKLEAEFGYKSYSRQFENIFSF